MNSIQDERHLDDAELVLYLDEGAAAEGAAAEGAPRWQQHIARCDRCAEAARSLSDDSRLLTEWLDRAAFEADVPTDPGGPAAGDPIPFRRRPGLAPWLRAAAILALLAAPLAAFPTLRAWVVESVTGPAAESGEAGAGVASAEEPTVVRFVPAAGEFVVRFEPGSRGVITVARSTDATAVLEAAGGELETTVSPSLLRIRNPAPARYFLRLPDATSGVWVRIGERAVSVSDSQIDRRAIVELP